MSDEFAPDDPLRDPKIRFKVNAYFAICDRVIAELDSRFEDFFTIVRKFSCLLPDQLGDHDSFKDLAGTYCTDVDIECANF